MSEQATALLKVHNLQLSYGPVGYCLEVDSLQVNAGQLVMIWGTAGSGKSRLLESLTGLNPLRSDCVQLLGQSLQPMSAEEASQFRLANLGLIFRKHNLVESLNVAENVALPAELNGVSHSKAQIAAGAHLQSVGCSKLAELFPSDLTPLEQLKVSLARAIISQGKLIVADEPAGDLNSPDTQQFMQLLVQQIEKGYGCLLATNDFQILQYAHQLYRIVDEKLVYSPRLLDQIKAGEAGFPLGDWNEGE